MNPKRRSLRIKAQTDAISHSTMNKNNLYLPEDLIGEHILSRLPVKSLLRFCCVSKRWRSIISSDPVFAKTHFKMASKKRPHKLFFTDFYKFRLLDLGATTTSFGKKSSFRKLTKPFRDTNHTICTFVGSVNGLVCIGDLKDDFYIWNPSIGFVQKLPKYDMVLPDNSNGVGYVCGFGYVSATDDYVPLIHILFAGIEPCFVMFSSRCNCWKRIGVPHLSIWGDEWDSSLEMGCLSNEALHWVQKNDTSVNEVVKYGILAFDLATEEFREVALPVDKDNVGEWAVVLSVILGGRLAITSKEELAGFESVVTVWTMREYGVRDSWSKLFKIGCRDMSWNLSSDDPILLVYEENGTIVLRGREWSRENYEEVVRFDCKENMCDDEVMVSSRWKDMVLVPQDKRNFDNLVVRTGRCKISLYGAFLYDESLLKIHL